MKIISKLLNLNNGKQQNIIFNDLGNSILKSSCLNAIILVMFMQKKFKNGGKMERDAFLDEMTSHQKEQAKRNRALRKPQAARPRKRGKFARAPRRNLPKNLANAPKCPPTAAANPELPPLTTPDNLKTATSSQ